MYVIAPMVLYICERLLRFVRYMQTVHYRKVRLIRDSSPLPSGLFCRLCYSDFNPFASLSDCDAAVQGAGAAAGEEWLQNGGGSVRLPQLPGHLPAGVAPVHHDLCPWGGLFQRPHPLGRGLDGQAHQHRAEATRGIAGTQVSTSDFMLSGHIAMIYYSSWRHFLPTDLILKGSLGGIYKRKNLHIHKELI